MDRYSRGLRGNLGKIVAGVTLAQVRILFYPQQNIKFDSLLEDVV
jgi:hypothetical protein